MVGQQRGELVDDRHAAWLAGLRGDELLGSAIPAPADAKPAALEVDGANIERQRLPEPQAGVDGQPERGPVFRAHRGDQLRCSTACLVRSRSYPPMVLGL